MSDSAPEPGQEPFGLGDPSESSIFRERGHERASESASELLYGLTPQEKLPYRDRRDQQKLQEKADEHELRKKVARWVYVATALQVLLADVAFYFYAAWGVHWNVPTQSISAWLAATVVQVIAVLLVITRYLFPTRRRKG